MENPQSLVITALLASKLYFEHTSENFDALPRIRHTKEELLQICRRKRQMTL